MKMNMLWAEISLSSHWSHVWLSVSAALIIIGLGLWISWSRPLVFTLAGLTIVITWAIFCGSLQSETLEAPLSYWPLTWLLVGAVVTFIGLCMWLPGAPTLWTWLQANPLALILMGLAVALCWAVFCGVLDGPKRKISPPAAGSSGPALGNPAPAVTLPMTPPPAPKKSAATTPALKTLKLVACGQYQQKLIPDGSGSYVSPWIDSGKFCCKVNIPHQPMEIHFPPESSRSPFHLGPEEKIHIDNLSGIFQVRSHGPFVYQLTVGSGQ